MRVGGPRTALLLAGVLLLGCAPSSQARHFFEERFSTRDGLPSELVKSVARDRYGFLWLATDAGLVRYDGERFSARQDDVSFPFGKGLLLTRDRRLLAVGDAGLVEIAGTPARPEFRLVFGAAPAPEPGALVAPRGIFEDGRGRLWVSEPAAIVRVDGEQLVRYGLPPSSHSASFLGSYCLAEDGLGALWAASQTGELYRFDEEADHFVPVHPDWPVTVLHQLRAVDGDRLWAATSRGLYEIRVTVGPRVAGVSLLADATQLSSFGRLGPDLVLGTYDLETYVGPVRDGRFTLRERLPVFIVQDMFEDDDGSLWLSTDEGLVHLRPTPFEPVRVTDARLVPYLVSFVQTADGALYACDRSRVYRLRPVGDRMRADPLLSQPSAFLLGLRTDGRFVWAAHETGLLEFEGDRFERSIPLEGAYAVDLEKDAHSQLWLNRASEDGLLRIAPDGSRREYGFESGLSAQVLALDRSPTGELVVATSDPTALVLRYDPDQDVFTPVVAELPFAPGDAFNVYDVKADDQGRYWVASTAGLLEVGRGEIRLVGVGPSARSSASSAVALADDGGVWFATSDGVVRLDPDSGRHQLFDERDGLPSRIVGVRDLYAGHGGRLTATTARGAARLVEDPSPGPDLPAPVLIGLRVGDQPTDPGADTLAVPHGSYVDVRFVSPYFARGLEYQVRVEGRDPSWRPTPNRGELLLAGLESGVHTIHLRAVLPGSDRASPATDLSLTVGRPWYLAWWALLLWATALGAVAWVAWVVVSWRSGRTEQRLRALVDERTRELSEANRQLGERNVEMERFIYTVSHDLKSPLISISGFIGLLEADLERGQLRQAGDYVARVKSSAARMVQLLDELLEMSRVGRVRDEPELVAPEPVLEDVTGEMAERLSARGVTVTVQPDLPTVYVDRSRLRQIVQNLLDNALKFLGDQDQPRIEVGGHREDGRARLFIRDNGIGIAPEHHEAAFELFRRLNARIDGTGVGLSLVKRIVEVHDGRIWIESEGTPGRGTTVWVDLPAAAGD